MNFMGATKYIILRHTTHKGKERFPEKINIKSHFIVILHSRTMGMQFLRFYNCTKGKQKISATTIRHKLGRKHKVRYQ